MNTYSYDIECLKNLFTATFVNVADETEKHVFYIGLGKRDYSDIIKFLKTEMELVGYNCSSYDDPMLRFIMGYTGNNIVTDLHSLSEKLVDDSLRTDRKLLALRYPRNIQYSWKSIDLMKMLGFDKLGISLKQVAINLKWYRIQDMPISHWESVQIVQLDSILDYNLNDVLITKRLYEDVKDLRELRSQLKGLYGIDFSSASKSKIGNLIFEKFYVEETHTDLQSLKDGRTKRYKIALADCIAKFVSFKSPELNEMLDRISSTIVYEYNKFRYSETIYFANCTISLGVGGIHTKDEPGKFISDNEYLIQDVDVSSYYPNLIINNNFYPAHLGKNFISVLKKITTERISAKRSKDKLKAESLKIAINSIFGKLGYENYFLYDPKQLLSTTVSGQMGLLMLMENLYLAGITVISCNTDGVVCKIPRSKLDEYYKIVKEWEDISNLEVEFTPYKIYVRRDVNSYITEQPDGTVKEKNSFLTEIDLTKSYHMPIVAKALRAYFLKDVPVKETISNCKDIMDFCISQKSGSDFAIELHTTKGTEKLQKTNRFYITTKGASLIKRQQYTNKQTGLYVRKLVRILNTYDSSLPFKDYNVNLSFYEREALDIIDMIEPKQISMFDMSNLGESKLNKAPVSVIQAEEKVEVFRVNDLNKLGKNQLSKKIELIASNNQSIAKISPRYIYILDLDKKTMMAEVYCLSKGIRQFLFISRGKYKETPFEKGHLVFCSKFANKNGEYSIVDYKVTDKIEEEKQEFDNF